VIFFPRGLMGIAEDVSQRLGRKGGAP
jgi:hypothetical protein